MQRGASSATVPRFQARVFKPAQSRVLIFGGQYHRPGSGACHGRSRKPWRRWEPHFKARKAAEPGFSLKQKSPANAGLFERSGGDSNPRYCLTQYDHLANGCFQPLSHRSVCGRSIAELWAFVNMKMKKMAKKCVCRRIFGSELSCG